MAPAATARPAMVASSTATMKSLTMSQTRLRDCACFFLRSRRRRGMSSGSNGSAVYLVYSAMTHHSTR